MMRGAVARGRLAQLRRLVDAPGEVLDLLEERGQRRAAEPRRDARKDDGSPETQRGRVDERPGNRRFGRRRLRFCVRELHG